MGANKEWLEGLKDATPEDRKLANEVLKAEQAQGIKHPELKEKEVKSD
jgi:hypothetical protein